MLHVHVFQLYADVCTAAQTGGDNRVSSLSQYMVFFEFNDRMEAVMKKAYIYRWGRFLSVSSQKHIINQTRHQQGALSEQVSPLSEDLSQVVCEQKKRCWQTKCRVTAAIRRVWTVTADKQMLFTCYEWRRRRVLSPVTRPNTETCSSTQKSPVCWLLHQQANKNSAFYLNFPSYYVYIQPLGFCSSSVILSTVLLLFILLKLIWRTEKNRRSSGSVQFRSTKESTLTPEQLA